MMAIRIREVPLEICHTHTQMFMPNRIVFIFTYENWSKVAEGKEREKENLIGKEKEERVKCFNVSQTIYLTDDQRMHTFSSNHHHATFHGLLLLFSTLFIFLSFFLSSSQQSTRM